MENRVKNCRIVSYVGIAMVLIVYIALTYASGNIERFEAIPAVAVNAMQILLGLGSGLTISGICMGVYYKNKIKNRPIKRKKGDK